MTTWLALDIGDRRIGLAIGNDQAWLAQPHSILTRRSKREDFDAIARIVEELGVDQLLTGLPYNMDGSEGPQAKSVRKYATKLRSRIELPMTFWDERLSSFEADQIISQSNKRRRSKHNDDVAAASFLQSYLNHMRQLQLPRTS